MDTGPVHELYLRASVVARAGQPGPFCVAGLEAKDLLRIVHASTRAGVAEILVAVFGADGFFSGVRLFVEHHHRAVSVSRSNARQADSVVLGAGHVAGRARAPA